jgi:flagellar motor component MotA
VNFPANLISRKFYGKCTTPNAYIPLKYKDQKYHQVINKLYDMQKQMHKTKQYKIEDRIVSIHPPHVRPMVRGKVQGKVEFGAKIHISDIDGMTFLDEISGTLSMKAAI